MAKFRLDEDSDCWCRRIIEDLELGNGDLLMLEGKADGEEKAILEFIEFIPKNRRP